MSVFHSSKLRHLDNKQMKIVPECQNQTKSKETRKNEDEGANHEEICKSDFRNINFKSDTLKSTWRTTLPSTRDKYSFSLFGFLKSTIGKDLTRVTMPVYFNEPLSFVQRLTEDLEYANILNKACECENTIERLAYVAAFASSNYANVTGRFWKPFNPLLGETFEYIDKEEGYSVICEQVSHHPPVSALHAESDGWVFWEEYKLDTRFRGLYVKIVPTGAVHVKFKKDNTHYSWKKPNTSIHNIVLGTLWVDHDGEVNVVSHQTGESAVVYFVPYKRSPSYKKLTGEVKDCNGVVQLLLEGGWEEGLKSIPAGDADYEPRELWKTGTKPEDSPRIFGFTHYAIRLNDQDDSITCPTDSRKRPDQRLLENGKVEEAGAEKHRLEEKQRTARKVRESRKETWVPRWFVQEFDPETGTKQYVYNGKYWTAKMTNNYDDSINIF